MDGTSHEMNNTDTNIFMTFSPRAYLEEYYSKPTPSKEQMLRFHARINAKLPAGGTMLEFGGGPSMLHLISAAARVDEIHFSDYLPKNLAEIQAWRDNKDNAFSWSFFFREALIAEGVEASDDAIQARQQLLRKKITKLLHVDARANQPLGSSTRQYDTVSVNFVLGSLSNSLSKWREMLKRVVDLVVPGGYLIMIDLMGYTYWELDGQHFPAIPLQLDDIIAAFNDEHVTVVHAEEFKEKLPDCVTDGYSGPTGVVMICGRREVAA
jgi:hypothetical protein